MEKCENCERQIGEFEQPYEYKGHTVCRECGLKFREKDRFAISQKKAGIRNIFILVTVLVSFASGIVFVVITQTKPPPRSKQNKPVATLAKVTPAISTHHPKAKPDIATRRKTQENTKPQVDCSKQRERWQLIQKGIYKYHLWSDTEFTGSLPKLWITSNFIMLDKKAQNTFLNFIYAYWMCEIEGFGKKTLYWEPLVLKMNNGTQNGKRVGEYTPVKGVQYYN